MYFDQQALLTLAELEERPGRHPVEKRFSLLGGGVERRQWLIDNLREDGVSEDYIDEYKNDVRDENVVQIVIKTPWHGLLRILWFGLLDWEKARTAKTVTKTKTGYYPTVLVR
ncbi:hypothetical protein VNI00_015737 [Paramarasmius palmivorus]|uniref:Uncharacterized protein n=1 Tax=Paramarasmius palmivorus TaxID=297713 RepID=A0AAW0BJZ1_9AGAR